MNYADLLPEVEKIAREAGREIMKYYNSATEYTKSDGSQVTDADYAAETIILTALEKLTPNIPIISEENVEKNIIPDISGGIFWVVDPLDGTKDFIEKRDGFGVAIALIVEGRPVLGVTDQPSLGWTYSACGLGTASKIDREGHRYPLIPESRVGKLKRFLVSDNYKNKPVIEKFLLGKFGSINGIEKATNIFRACQVAEGWADLSVSCSSTHEGRACWWDVAPCQVIVESVGGFVEDFDGNALIYNAADMRVPSHILMAP